MQTVVKTKVEFRCGKDGRLERVEGEVERLINDIEWKD